MADTFTERLIKGRIAETVFERMFREETKFDIYPLGYEYTLPILIQFKEKVQHQYHKETIEKIIHNFDNTPDYLLVKPDKSELYIVEVKYMAMYNNEVVLHKAQKITERWDPAWLFVATKDGFYFDSCHGIINDGKIKPMDTKWISDAAQKEFLKLINAFEE